MKVYFFPEDILQIKKDVEKILDSGMLTLGKYTQKFEREYAKFCGVRHAVAVNSGTGALEIALRAISLKNREEVLVPTNTFTATAAAVFFAGGKPVFTDISSETCAMDPKSLQKNLTKNTKAVLVVHVGGFISPDIVEIAETCNEKDIFLIEDAAHAHGSQIDGRQAGSLGDLGCFSFYPTKVMTTGEGGMITTDNDEIAEKAITLRDQGKENFHSNIILELGYNWRMPEINAAIGLVQLKRLPEIIKKRNKIAQYYGKKLKEVGGISPLKNHPNTISNYYKYIAFLDSGIDREKFKQSLAEKGVRCSGEVYWPPLHLQPVYQKLINTNEGDFPVAEEVCRRMVCLPIFGQMTDSEAKYVVEKINEVMQDIGVN